MIRSKSVQRLWIYATLTAIAAIMILGSSLALASQPVDEGTESTGPVIGGGAGKTLKK